MLLLQLRLAYAFIAFLVLPDPVFASRTDGVVRRDDLTIASDICGEVDADLNIPNPLSPINSLNFGHITQCLCISNVPSYMSTSPFALAAMAFVGKELATQSLTDLIHKCPGQTCNYPPHSVPVCQPGNPCGFSCKDGYMPYPAYKPTQCVCNPPYTECNGKCGVFNGCASGYIAKRDLPRGKRCPTGHMACGVPTRGASSWECIDTQTELESCGGCVLSLYGDEFDAPQGMDCTAIPGVADVSCVRGACSVHRCMPGYHMNLSGTSCVYVEDEDPVILASQYGLEHVPF